MKEEGKLLANGEAIYDLVAGTLGHALQAYEATVAQIHALSDEELEALMVELREGELDPVAEEMLRIAVTECAARWMAGREQGAESGEEELQQEESEGTEG